MIKTILLLLLLFPPVNAADDRSFENSVCVEMYQVILDEIEMGYTYINKQEAEEIYLRCMQWQV